MLCTFVYFDTIVVPIMDIVYTVSSNICNSVCLCNTDYTFTYPLLLRKLWSERVSCVDYSDRLHCTHCVCVFVYMWNMSLAVKQLNKLKDFDINYLFIYQVILSEWYDDRILNNAYHNWLSDDDCWVQQMLFRLLMGYAHNWVNIKLIQASMIGEEYVE